MKQEIEQKELGMGNFQGYPSLLRQIKHRVSFAQQKAMYAANEELLRMNWDIGEMLTKSQEADGWGKKTLQRLAVDLKNEYPERKGFSVRNMQCMMQFYNEYNKELTMVKVGHFSIAQPLVAQLKNNVNTLPIKQYNDHKLASNIERFPNDFRFELSKEECLRSQIVTSNGRGGNRYSTYAFTEQGVAMLSSVLRSKTAIEVNIQIMRAFVSMRHFMVNNASVFSRLETMEYHQLEILQHQQDTDKHIETTNKRIDEVFRRLDEGNTKPKQGVFYNGQIYDAYTFVSDLIKGAKKRIILIDNYVDETVLTLLDKREPEVTAVIYTQQISRHFQLDIDRHNAQYAPIAVETFRLSHDRFLCIDDDVYHIGASIKDLGKKWFGFSKMEILTPNELVERINRG